jgi:hypothetical protein
LRTVRPKSCELQSFYVHDDYRKDSIEFIAVGHGYTETGIETPVFTVTEDERDTDDLDTMSSEENSEAETSRSSSSIVGSIGIFAVLLISIIIHLRARLL